MNKLNQYTFEMKMKRHKLSYSYSNDNQALTLGKATTSIITTIPKVIVPLLIGIAALLIVIFVPLYVKLFYLLVIGAAVATIGYSFGIIVMVMTHKKSNKLARHLSRGRITLESKNKSPRHFELNDIRTLLAKVTRNNESGVAGVVQFQDNNGEFHDLVGIIDKDKFKLEEDLKYIRDYLAMFIGMESSDENQ